MLITLKEFKMHEAERLGVSLHAIANRMSRGGYKHMTYIRKNPRVVMVEVSWVYCKQCRTLHEKSELHQEKCAKCLGTDLALKSAKVTTLEGRVADLEALLSRIAARR